MAWAVALRPKVAASRHASTLGLHRMEFDSLVVSMGGGQQAPLASGPGPVKVAASGFIETQDGCWTLLRS
ncbi:hypothetical protein GCM10023095_07160 [Pseudaeromonas paramecii]|uniref:Uncharacterized protein n=1 Tax=Pseudaeromonas paramecii TaxID=2138166 RepID=A0ABP8Q1H4_9GAMM